MGLALCGCCSTPGQDLDGPTAASLGCPPFARLKLATLTQGGRVSVGKGSRPNDPRLNTQPLTLKSVLLTCSKTRAGVRDCRAAPAAPHGWGQKGRERLSLHLRGGGWQLGGGARHRGSLSPTRSESSTSQGEVGEAGGAGRPGHQVPERGARLGFDPDRHPSSSRAGDPRCLLGSWSPQPRL